MTFTDCDLAIQEFYIILLLSTNCDSCECSQTNYDSCGKFGLAFKRWYDDFERYCHDDEDPEFESRVLERIALSRKNTFNK